MKRRGWKEHFLSILLCLTMVMGQVFPLAGLVYASGGGQSVQSSVYESVRSSVYKSVQSSVYEEETTPFVVTFHGNGGYFGESETVTRAVYVLPEEKVSSPDPDPIRDAEGDTQYSFTGWYTAAQEGSAYDFDQEVTEPLDLYAQWTAEVNDGVSAWYLNDPEAAAFTISNEAELRCLAQLVNGTALDGDGSPLGAVDFLDKTITLAEDIALTEEWIPIGTSVSSSNRFRGTFEGNNKTISSLTIGSAEEPAGGDYKGLFGYTNGAAIQNLKVTCAINSSGNNVGGVVGYLNAGGLNNVTVEGSINSTGDYVGGIAGTCAGGPTVQNCGTGALTVMGKARVGGIAGQAAGTFSNCQTAAGVRVSGTTYVGGITGYATSALSGCANMAAVSGTGDYAGGIAGYGTAGISNCQNGGEITGGSVGEGGIFTGSNYVGGIAGYITATTLALNNCVNGIDVEGTIKGNIRGGSYVAGIAGAARLTVTFTNCANNAAVTGTGANVAGIMGYNPAGSSSYGKTTFTGCVNTGDITGTDYTAGIAGQLPGASTIRSYGVFEGCSNTGSIAGVNYVGGIAGANSTFRNTYPTSLTKCFNTGSITGTGNNIGGVAGSAGQYSTITACYNTGAVSCTAETAVAVGGIAGANGTATSQTGCFNYGQITAAGTSSAGAIAGQGFEANTGCYYLDTSIAVPVDAGGETPRVTPRTAAEFKQIKMAYDLNTPSGGVNSGLWSRDAAADHPVLADDTHGAVCKITINESEHGTVTVTDEYAVAGSLITPAITPEAGYVLQELLVAASGGTTTSYCGSGLNFTMPAAPAADVTLTATFAGTGGAAAFPVTFYGNGGYFADGGAQPTEITVDVVPGEKVSAPAADPFRDTDSNTQYTFAGWYTDAAGTTAYDFNKAVVADLVIYAKWHEVDRVMVKFNLNQSDPFVVQKITDLGIAPAGQVAYRNHLISKPAGFLEEGETISTAALIYEFQGWYTAAAGSEKWDFALAVIPADYAVDSLTLYARWALPVPASHFEEVGNAADPYQIENLTDLNNFRKSVNEGINYEGKYLLLVNDLDLSDLDPAETWTPIGAGAAYPFKGSFDGNDKTISNLNIAGGTNQYQGLFGYVAGVAIKDLKVTGSVAGGNYTGGIAGYAAANTKFINCTFGDENVSSAVAGAGMYTGGLAGYIAAGGRFENCRNYGAVSSTNIYAGGITGYAIASEFTDCTNNGMITGSGTESQGIGGIAGVLATSFSLLRCSNTNSVNSLGYYAGGIVGSVSNNASGTITLSGNSGAVSGAFAVGGIVGYLGTTSTGKMTVTLTKCYNTGDIGATAPYNEGYAAGIAGNTNMTASQANTTSYILESCYNTGTVVSPGSYVGGIAGRRVAGVTLENCHNYGTVKVDPAANMSCGAIAPSAIPLPGNYYLQGCVVSRADDEPLAVFGDTTYSTGKSKDAFTSGEVAYLLNTFFTGAAPKVWSQYNGEAGGEICGYPVFADAANGLVYKVDGGDFTAPEGSVTCDGHYVKAGQTVTLTVTPAEGYLLRNLSVNKTGGGLIASDSGEGVETLSFTMPESDVIVTSEFVEIASLEAQCLLSFNANGGTFEPADANDMTRSVQVQGGQKIAAEQIPANPTRASGIAEGVTTNYTFAGWYLDMEGTIPYDPNLIVTQSAAVYARWAEDYIYTVTFNANGGTFTGGSAGITQEVNHGQFAASPTPAPERAGGFTFNGWYRDPGAALAYHLNTTPVTGPLTLYAGWLKEGATIVTFDLNYAGADPGQAPSQLIVTHGQTVSEPSEFITDVTVRYTTIDGVNVASHTFKGWYTAAEGGVLWNFVALLDASHGAMMTLYAQWETEDLFATSPPSGIGSKDMLTELARQVRQGSDFAGQTFTLTGDITLDSSWPGIGTKDHPFNGTFSGNGRTLTMNGCQNPLFISLGTSAQVSGLTLTGTATPSQDRFGAVAGESAGTISNCTTSVAFAANNRQYVGGIVGWNSGDVDNCRNQGTVRGGSHVGGVIGYCGNRVTEGVTVENCTNSGAVYAAEYTVGGVGGVGGIIGSAGTTESGGRYPLEILNCSNSADLTLDGPRRVGGIIGHLHGKATVTNCRNNGNITLADKGATSSIPLPDGVGGIVGLFQSTGVGGAYIVLEGCTNTGNVNGADVIGVGGILGNLRAGFSYQSDTYDIRINGCDNSGTIRGFSKIGGLAGLATGIGDSWNTGDITGSEQSSDVGGLVGQFCPDTHPNNNTNVTFLVSKSYSTGNVTGGNRVGGLIGFLDHSYGSSLNNLSKVVNSYSTGNISAMSSNGNAGGLIGGTSPGAGFVIDVGSSYWYGQEIACEGTKGAITAKSYTYLAVANCFYGLKTEQAEEAGVFALTDPTDEPPLTDPNDGNGAALKDTLAFAGGEVAYLLDGGDTLPHQGVWTQDVVNGYPVFGTPSYYMAEVTVSGGGGGSATINQLLKVYAPSGTALTVTIEEETVTIDGVDYNYNFERLEVNDQESPTAFTMPSAGNAAVTAFFAMAEVPIPVIPEVPDVPDTDDDDQEEEPQDTTGGGGGSGGGKGGGQGAGEGKDDGTGTGQGGSTGGGSSAGQGGSAETTTSEQTGAPSTAGENITSPPVIAQLADETAFEQNTAEREQDEGGSPAGGSPGEGDEENDEDVQLTVFEIVRDIVKKNPLTTALITVIILGIMGMAGYRRYKRHMGDIKGE